MLWKFVVSWLLVLAAAVADVVVQIKIGLHNLWWLILSLPCGLVAFWGAVALILFVLFKTSKKKDDGPLRDPEGLLKDLLK